MRILRDRTRGQTARASSYTEPWRSKYLRVLDTGREPVALLAGISGACVIPLAHSKSARAEAHTTAGSCRASSLSLVGDAGELSLSIQVDPYSILRHRSAIV